MRGINDRDPINLQPGVNHAESCQPGPDFLQKDLVCSPRVPIPALFLNSSVSQQLNESKVTLT